MSTGSFEPPSAEQVAAALSNVYWVYLDEGGDGGVFDYDLVEVNPSSEGAYEVTLTVYSFWGDFLEMETNEIRVQPWNFSFEVCLDPTTDQWISAHEGLIEASEGNPELIISLSNPSARIEKLINRDFDSFDTDELTEFHLDRSSKTIRPYLESHILKRQES